jgi:N-acetylmuramic acid 6-phosphate etherase
MIKIDRIKGNKMVNMQLTNHKLVERAIQMIMDELKTITKERAAELLSTYGSVKNAIDHAKD